MAYGLLYDYLTGQCINAYQYFGAHFEEREYKDGKKTVKETGVVFRLYAPLAEDVSVIGEWNYWDVGAHKMNKIDDSGIWEVYIPNLRNYQSYKFHFKNCKGRYVDKIDPFAFFAEEAPGTCSRLFDNRFFQWHDDDWLRSRSRNFDQAMSIYECHIGSWMGRSEDGHRRSYEEIADIIIPYISLLYGNRSYISSSSNEKAIINTYLVCLRHCRYGAARQFRSPRRGVVFQPQFLHGQPDFLLSHGGAGRYDYSRPPMQHHLAAVFGWQWNKPVCL